MDFPSYLKRSEINHFDLLKIYDGKVNSKEKEIFYVYHFKNKAIHCERL
jgi:hypothetical protein